MKRLSQTASAITLGIALQTANAGENFVRPEPIIIGSPEFQKICEDAKNKTGLLLDGQEICEISVDQGKTWVSLVEFLAAGGVLVGVGVLAYMIRRRKKKGDREVDSTEKGSGIVGNIEIPVNVQKKSVDPHEFEKIKKQMKGEEKKNGKVREILEDQRQFKELVLGKIRTLKKTGERFEINGNIVERVNGGYKLITKEDVFVFDSVEEFYMKLSTLYGTSAEQIAFLNKLGTREIIARFNKLAGKEISDTGIRIVKNEKKGFVFEKKVSDGRWDLIKTDKISDEESENILEKEKLREILEEKSAKILRKILRTKGGGKIQQYIGSLKS
ncbi:hypothetical protein AUJ87_03345 [Candidatus Gracilibacteria bacterium CG1_02_38_174]|nr:MAG: hypothetical protein AUJ87_03345 [Candidatus Gracilibacteria bacterium CG1_02_38_174]PIQ12002.1 MAG: hypothetical protein COW68_01225 [Candidatus Gracilibacteria bacterium CG18_big_fil_WC_8_21_14_2_50_38_16]PIQ41294.1 MAG: hypothetical protein COW06_03375 [Candidatus Gracilibacteria bacterium CG12_big_fil_rev_8_21_14_0_65_38_15]PIZ01622.1 MAG: hypothetical protein COY60_02580 [Candidatus Gracilibacteria bacterium CG_4_10_14_0_8_um_filter_38_28]